MAGLPEGVRVASVAEVGFVFWGLFAAFGAIVGAYVLWMWWTERDGAGERPEEPPAGEDGP